jgi:multiple sugar transport system permease protein
VRLFDPEAHFMQADTPSQPGKQSANLIHLVWSRNTKDIGPFGFIFMVVVLLGFVVFFGLPLIWLLIAPSKSDPQMFALSPLAFGSVTRYIRAWFNLMTFNDGAMKLWAFNSLYYVAVSLVLSLAFTLPAGYMLAVARFQGRYVILWLTLITMMLPGSALVLPLFMEMNLFHLVNTAWAVILPAVFFPFGVYLTYIYYGVSLPKDILDAARVDGASEFGLFRHVGLPLAYPLMGLLLFINFNGLWNNYFGPFVMLNDDKLYNLPVGIQALISSTNALRFGALSPTDLPLYRAEVAMSGMLMVLPVVIVFIFSQRYVISGAFLGSIKG